MSLSFRLGPLFVLLGIICWTKPRLSAIKSQNEGDRAMVLCHKLRHADHGRMDCGLIARQARAVEQQPGSASSDAARCDGRLGACSTWRGPVIHLR